MGAAQREAVNIAHENRTARQQAAVDWAVRVFGEDAKDRRILALRFLEEALELCQTQGLKPHDLTAVKNRVFERPAGDVKAEIGGVMVTLYCLAGNLGLDVDSCEASEIARVHTLPPEHFAKTQIEKKAQGLK